MQLINSTGSEQKDIARSQMGAGDKWLGRRFSGARLTRDYLLPASITPSSLSLCQHLLRYHKRNPRKHSYGRPLHV